MPPPRIPAQTYADSYPFASSYESEKVLQRRQMECEEQRKALMRDERPISPKQRRQKEYEEQLDARMRERTSAANARIARRPAVPLGPSTSTAGATYAADLNNSVNQPGISSLEAQHRSERDMQKQLEAEDEAQRQRLLSV
jgi:hypothetical protein